MRSTKHPMVLGMNFYGHNEKIVIGLTEADTLKHYLDLSPWVPKNTVAIIMIARRASGTGRFKVYPNEGPEAIIPDNRDSCDANIVAIKNQRLQYALTVANDVWDIYLYGYFVERVMGE